MNANERQVGGDHYKQKDGSEEHWDRVARLGLDYFQGQITKYVERCWKKNGLDDLRKARHFLDKYIELKEAEAGKAVPSTMNHEELTRLAQDQPNPYTDNRMVNMDGLVQDPYQDAKPSSNADPSHQWVRTKGTYRFRCTLCQAYENMGSGAMECKYKREEPGYVEQDGHGFGHVKES